MSDFKKCNIIILPTEKVIKFDPLDQVWTIPVGDMIITNDDSVGKCLKRGEVTHYHLYITSDEEIEEGWKGWAYKDDVKGKIFKHSYTTNPWYKDARKIVATTDKSLLNDFGGYEYGTAREYSAKVYLLQIPQSFIRKYVEVGGKIGEIDMFKENIETDSGDYIILKPAKKYWTREEVEDMLFDISTELSWDDKDEDEKILNCQDKIKEIRESLYFINIKTPYSKNNNN